MHEWKVDKADDSLKTQRSVSVFHILFCPTSYYLQFKLTTEFCKELEYPLDTEQRARLCELRGEMCDCNHDLK